MIRALTTLLFAPLALAWAERPFDPTACNQAPDLTVGPSVPPGINSASPSLTGDWTLVWDDSADLQLDSEEKACTVRLDGVSDDVVGAFSGPVLGRAREAIFTGERIGAGAAAVLLLVQREADYACSYQLQGADDGGFLGTWCDTRGASGTVVMRRSSSVEAPIPCACDRRQAPPVLRSSETSPITET